MKRFIVKILIIVFILLFFVTIIDIFLLHGKDVRSLPSHEKNVILAYNRLKALGDTNKIVIIAGSNGGFSINSRMINETFHEKVVNTCTHAGIGVRMEFEMYKEFLHRGDVVIFCPEYGGSKSRLYGESSLFRILSSHMPFAYKKISFNQWCYLYKYIGVHYNELIEHQKWKDYYKDLGPYSSKSLNEFGDIECERIHKDSIELYNIGGKMSKVVIDYYKYIHSFTKENGIKLIFLPPTLIESCYLKNKNQIDSLADCLKRNGIPLQALPSRYVFPDSMFFDTPYHMTQSGANERTKLIIEDMNALLGH